MSVGLHVDFEPHELESNMSNALRIEHTNSQRFALPGCLVDLELRQLVKGDEVISLTTTEAELLEYLAKSAGRIDPMVELTVEDWGYSLLSRTKTVYVNICFLRNKLEEDPRNPVVIRTIRGSGYVFDVTGGKDCRQAA